MNSCVLINQIIVYTDRY